MTALHYQHLSKYKPAHVLQWDDSGVRKSSIAPSSIQLSSSRFLKMPPHLHPRSRSTLSLFTATLGVSFVVVGLPHLFPCPAPRRTFADSDPTMTTADGQQIQIQRIRRKRRKDQDPGRDAIVDPMTDTTAPGTHGTSSPGSTSNSAPSADEEVSTFLQMEDEARRLATVVGRECPVPKPGGRIGEWLGFKREGVAQTRPQQRPFGTRSGVESPSDTAIKTPEEEG